MFENVNMCLKTWFSKYIYITMKSLKLSMYGNIYLNKNKVIICP